MTLSGKAAFQVAHSVADDDGVDAGYALRSPQAVAQRVLALLATIGRAREEVAMQSVTWVKRNGIDGFFSAAERRFYFFGRRPDAHAITNFSWRAEAIVPLVWSLGGLDELPPLDRQVNVWELAHIQFALRSPDRFVVEASLRPMDEIVEQESRHYEAHRRVAEAQRRAIATPAGLNGSIVVERRYALSWLAGYGDDWDEVPMDI